MKVKNFSQTSDEYFQQAPKRFYSNTPVRLTSLYADKSAWKANHCALFCWHPAWGALRVLGQETKGLWRCRAYVL